MTMFIFCYGVRALGLMFDESAFREGSSQEFETTVHPFCQVRLVNHVNILERQAPAHVVFTRSTKRLGYSKQGTLDSDKKT